MNDIVRLSPQEMDRLSQIMYRLAQDPKTRAQTAHLVAQIDAKTAKAAFQDVALETRLQGFMKKFEEDRLKERMEQVKQGNAREKANVVQKYGFNADQVKQLENIQTQYGFSNWDAAARILSTYTPADDPRLKPPPELTSESTWDFPTVPGPDGKPLEFKDFIKDPRKYAKNTAIQMITEFKRKTLPASFRA